MALRLMRGRGFGTALLLALFSALATNAGCVAPAIALSDINTAQAELAAARTAEAPRLAPYEYTLAEVYLDQARLRMGSSDYQESYEYARKATAFARQAVEKAESHAEPAAASPAPAAPDLAPAAASPAPAAPTPESKP